MDFFAHSSFIHQIGHFNLSARIVACERIRASHVKRMKTKAKRKRVKHIALALPLDVVFVERLLPGILDFARNQGGWVFTQIPERLSPSFEWLRNWEGDGAFVLIGSQADAKVARSLAIPIVNVGGYVRDERIPTVTLDQQKVGRLAAEHLIVRRFQRFGYYGVRGLWYSEQRRIGFEAAVREAGFACSSTGGTTLAQSARDLRREAGELMRWLRSLKPPIGILASWDLRAQMLSEACRMIGLRVPEDVAIIGVDNDPIACEFCIPQLSSVSRNDRELGWRAANLLSQLLEGKRSLKLPILIPPDRVVARQSTDVLAIEDSEIAGVVQHVRDHLNEVFGVERMLQLSPLSRRQLEQRFRRSVGSSPYVFLNELRVERAKTLLTEVRKRTLTRIASECGFSELRRFRTVFRRLTKLSPAEYRRNHLKQATN
jgi:LacI family transcriptional regulator